MSNNNQSSVDAIIKFMKENQYFIGNDLYEFFEQAKKIENAKAFDIFKAGQDSMEEGGKGFDQYYNETFEQ